MNWQKAISLEELKTKNRVLFKAQSRQVVLFYAGNKVYAIDNRCPHEGYPLIQGTLDENCILTCNWHNWKFDLRNGECRLGEDKVRNYDTKVEDNFVWVDISAPPKEHLEKEILAGLKESFEKRQYGRMSRELSRLYYNELDPLLAIKKGLKWSYDKLEFGTSHAYAAAADWLDIYNKNDNPENKIISLTEALDHMAFDSLRHKIYPYTTKKSEFNYDGFIKAVEEENEEKAISYINGSGFHETEKLLTDAALRHYNDFGHSLIYVYKTGSLISMLGTESEKYLVPPVVRSLCYTTKDDLLPEFRKYNHYLESFDFEKKVTVPLDIDDILGSWVNQSMEWTAENTSSANIQDIYEMLLESNCRNLLYFDTTYQFSYDRPVPDNVGWLDFTHALTFSNAVRIQCSKFPEFWKNGLLQMACFNGRNSRYIDLEDNQDEWFVTDEKAFWEKTFGKILDHGINAPVFAAHLLKTFVAVKEEAETVKSESCKKYLLASLNRFLNSPLKGKHVRRTVRQSMELVGKDFGE